MYNGKNAGFPDKPDPTADSSLGSGAYAAGQALFDEEDLTKLKGRLGTAQPAARKEL